MTDDDLDLDVVAALAGGMTALSDTLRMFAEVAAGFRAQLLQTWPQDTADSLSADLLHHLISKFLGGHDD